MRSHIALILAAFGFVCLCGGARADTLYVSNFRGNTIEKFTAGGVGSVFANTGLLFPEGIAFDSAGNLYVGNEGAANNIEKFAPGGVGTLFAANISEPHGLAFDGVGNLYVSTNFAIAKLTPAGVMSVFAGGLGSAPQGLAFDGAGNLYAANGSATIRKITPAGIVSSFSSPLLSQPTGLAFDAAGNLFVADNIQNRIVKFTPGGIGSLFASMVDPVGLAFDSSGNLYAASESTNTIEKFTPGGVGSVFATTGLIQPTYIAIQPGLAVGVPLPTGLASMLLMLAALPAAHRWARRRCDSLQNGNC